MPVGTYDLASYANKNADDYERMLAQMNAAVDRLAKLAKDTNNKSGLPDAKGVFIVEDWQTNLKKVSLQLRWTPTRPGDTGSYDRVIYLHKESRYE